MSARGFIKLLLRYKAGNVPKRVKEVMDIWYDSLHRDPFEINSKAEIGDRIWAEITAETEKPEAIVLHRKRNHWIWKAAAALVLVGTAYFYANYQVVKQAPPYYTAALPAGAQWLEVTNNTKRIKLVTLEDGSRVSLEPGSKLWYPDRFEVSSRRVQLEGNGFFQVTKDTEKPFLVYSGSVLTRVLGTSFRIKAIEKTGGTEVAVVTGKVIVEKANPDEPDTHRASEEVRVVLTPNKKVTFFKNSNHYVTGLIENPLIVTNKEEYLKPGAFAFDETPLFMVLDKLERAYGVEITLSNDGTMNCPITADLTTDSLLGKVEIIAAVLNAKYEITGSAILLSGGGCTATKPIN